MSRLPSWEVSREDSGDAIALHIKGHDLNDDEAVAYAWGLVILEEIGWGYDGDGPSMTFNPPRRVWLRKIPGNDESGYPWIAHRYQGFPARGASPITLVEFASSWRYRCDLPGCENHYVKGGARTGFPVFNFIDPPKNRQDQQHVYMCARHARDFSARLDAERKRRMAAYYAERAAS